MLRQTKAKINLIRIIIQLIVCFSDIENIMQSGVQAVIQPLGVVYIEQDIIYFYNMDTTVHRFLTNQISTSYHLCRHSWFDLLVSCQVLKSLWSSIF